MKWSVINDRSNQHVHQRFVSTWSQIWPNRVEISVDFPNASATLCASRPIFILFILAIVLAIATIFGDLFVNENKWEKSGLSGLLLFVFNTIGCI